MNKKIGFIGLVCILGLNFSACSSSNNIPIDSSPAPTEYTVPFKQKTTYNQKSYKEYMIDDLSEGASDVPSSVIDSVKLYKENLSAIDSSVEQSDFIDVYDDSVMFGSTIYASNGLSMMVRASEIYRYSLSYILEYDEPASIKSHIAALIKMISPSYSVEDATTKAQEVADSVESYGRGKDILIDDVTMYTVTYGSGTAKSLAVIAVKRTQATPPSEYLSEYHEINYDTAKNSTMNKGMKCVVVGTIDTFTLDGIGDFNTIYHFIVTDSNGDEYKMYYDYRDIPHYLNVHETHTFYCSIDDDTTKADIGKPYLRVDWVE